jgi:hypothetical protein
VPNIDVRAYLVSQVVASSTGGGFLFSEDQIRGVYYGSLDCITALNKSSIFVGELIKAWSVSRAILFKYLCDRVDVPCKIYLRQVSPSFMPATKAIHGIAWIRSGDRTSIVDLLGNIGSLYEEDKARFYEELNIEQLGLRASIKSDTTHPLKEKDPKSSHRWFEEIDFNRSQVQPLNLLGKGRYGQVYKAKVGNFICALKIVRMESMPKDIKKSIHREVSLMRILKHDNIVSYLGQEVVSENELHLFLELITKPLDKVVDAVKAKEREPLKNSELLVVAKAVCSALMYIHNLPTRLMHRDVKARNVLVEVDDSGFIIQAKLCDFGLATEVYNEKENQLAVGTSRWMAPEVHAMSRYDEKVDVWSFGMLLYELCAMKLPYHEICVLDVKQEILNGRTVDLDSVNTDWPDVSVLIGECTRFDPKLRPSAEQILSKLESMVR